MMMRASALSSHSPPHQGDWLGKPASRREVKPGAALGNLAESQGGP